MSSAEGRAARVWQQRRRSELEAAARFEMLATELSGLDAPGRIVELARHAAADERRHAALCSDLVHHFGSTCREDPPIVLRRVAPRHLSPRDRTLYEIVAMSCVTETLSTALLGALVEQATDSFARQTMHTILRDEVLHSQLGWSYLAAQEEHDAADCIGAYLPPMLDATVGVDLFEEATDRGTLAPELSGLGCLDVETSRRVVCDTLEMVIFPGLRRFGVDVTAAQRWLRASGEGAHG